MAPINLQRGHDETDEVWGTLNNLRDAEQVSSSDKHGFIPRDTHWLHRRDASPGIIGVTVGVTLLVIVLGVLGFLWSCKKSQAQEKEKKKATGHRKAAHQRDSRQHRRRHRSHRAVIEVEDPCDRACRERRPAERYYKDRHLLQRQAERMRVRREREDQHREAMVIVSELARREKAKKMRQDHKNAEALRRWLSPSNRKFGARRINEMDAPQILCEREDPLRGELAFVDRRMRPMPRQRVRIC